MYFFALSLPVLALVYHQLTTNLDLFPFNNVRDSTPAERLKEGLSSGIIMLLPIIFIILAGLFHSNVLGYIAAGWGFFIFIGASLTWWPPYFFGKAIKWAAGASKDDWNMLYNRTFAKTIIIVPSFKGRPRPNLEHNILHAIILAGAIVDLVWALSL
jgi:hypothetical protein